MKIALPDVTKWDQLFEKTERWPTLEEIKNGWEPSFMIPMLRSKARIPFKRSRQYNQPLGPYMVVRREHGIYDRYAFAVLPTQQVIDFCDKHMLTIERDVIYFSALARKDGVLVTVSYNQILGTRWLAMLPTEELPIEIEVHHG